MDNERQEMVFRLVNSIRNQATMSGTCICGAETEYAVVDEEDNVYQVFCEHAHDCFVRLAGYADAPLFITLTKTVHEESDEEEERHFGT